MLLTAGFRHDDDNLSLCWVLIVGASEDGPSAGNHPQANQAMVMCNHLNQQLVLEVQNLVLIAIISTGEELL